jgi:hypothetical protein
MALRSTQPLTKMSTKCISWGKGGRYIRLTTLPPFYVDIMKSGNLDFLETSGPLQACNGTALTLPFTRWECVVNETPRPPCPRERPGTYCIGGWVGPSSGLKDAENLAQTGIRSLDHLARSESLYRLSYPVPHFDILGSQ